MKIMRYDDYNHQNMILDDFLKAFEDQLISESILNKDSFNKAVKKIKHDLKLNLGFVSTFGLGLTAIFPIVDKLMKNMGVESFNLSIESIVLLVLTSFSIIYLEDKKFKSSDEEQELIKESKSMLEELKMRGFGNGIVKKVVKLFRTVFSFFKVISKHIGHAISGIADMFAYTSLLFPVLNGISYIIGKYDLNIDSLIQNLRGLAIGVGTLVVKQIIIEILNRVKTKFPINRKKVIDEIGLPAIQKFTTFSEPNKEEEKEGELINEQ